MCYYWFNKMRKKRKRKNNAQQATLDIAARETDFYYIKVGAL